MNEYLSFEGHEAADAVDRDPRDRPGVPMLPTEPAPIGSYVVPQQVPEVEVLVSVDVGELTPVFSSAVPPRWCSGALRRRAYAVSEHKARRWLLLLLADRVDVWEHRLERQPWLFAGIGAATVIALAALRRRPLLRR